MPPLPHNSFSRSPERSPQSLTKTTYTIACIDDSPTVLSAIETFLDDKAFKVIRIENPVSALMTIIRNKPDLVLLDVTMPSLDGYELCSLLRRHPAFKHTPIIMVTGNRGFIDRAKAKLVGATGYLTKPFTQPDLLKIIFKHLT
jgi:twitching motility two-component system response regulator PilG